MKFTRTLLYSGIATVILALAVTVLARIIAPPPTAAEVAGVYSGYGSQVEFLRLELDTNGTGYLCVSYVPASPARLYRVESWRLSDWIVELQTRPLDKDAETITFRKLSVGLFALEGEFGGRSGWKREIKLYSEREWQSRAVPAEQRISRYRKEKQ